MSFRSKVLSRSAGIFFSLLFLAIAAVPRLSAQSNCVTVASNLVSWWRAEGNATDFTGNNNGTLVGNVTYGPGKVGQAFVLDGSGDAILLGNPTNLQLQNFTIAAWVKRSSSNVVSLDENPDHNCLFFGYGWGGYGFGMYDDGRVFITRVGSDNRDTAVPAVTDTNWHHVAVAKSDNMVIFYVDGVAYPSIAYTTLYSFDSNVAIGARGDIISPCFYGCIDELSVYSRPLTAPEVLSLYVAGNSGGCLPDPYILSQPTNEVAVTGDTVIFDVQVQGTQPISYQWRRQLTNINGAIGASLILTNVQLFQAGSYSVIVSNAGGAIVSSNAVLTVHDPVCMPASSNLVSWWRAEGDASDFTGNNNGTPTNNIGFVAGEVGQGFKLNGNGDAILLGHPASLQVQVFTIEGWIKRTSSTLASQDGNPTHNCLFLSYGSGGYGFGMFDDGRLILTQVDNSDVRQAIPAVTDTNWHHVAVTKSGSAVVFYLDGAAVTNFDYSTSFVFTTPIAIGARGDDLTRAFYGQIDELAFYNRALLPEDVLAIYNARQEGKCPVPYPPRIILQPLAQEVFKNETATFNVISSGTPPLYYQWKWNDTNITGANASTLTLTNVQSAAAGNYTVMVSNAVNMVVSSNASLTVIVPECSPVTSNLVSWWRAEGDTSDFAGNDDGTLIGNTFYDSGRTGEAFILDGNGDAISLGNSSSLQLQNFTIEGWIKRASVTLASTDGNIDHDGLFLSYGNGGYGFGIYDDGRLFLTRVGSSNVKQLTPTITDTNWHHVAVTKFGTSVYFYLDGEISSTAIFGSSFSFTTKLAIGARGDNYVASFYGAIDELAVYNRALSTNEIQKIYFAGYLGKCPVTIAPAVVTQPVNQAAPAGGNVTFTLKVSGTAPLAYQWRLNESAIPNGTNATLTVTNLQFKDIGNYSVVITNSAGMALSSNAFLTVNYPTAVVQVASSMGLAGDSVPVSVQLQANGNESALNFSLNYDTNLLAVENVVAGPDAAGAALVANLSQTNSGRVGVSLLLLGGNTFAPGTQDLAVVNFKIVAAPESTDRVANLVFGDTPSPRRLADGNNGDLPAYYTNGALTIPAADWEGDVSPRTNGNHQLDISDWLQVGRFVAGLDTPGSGIEYQRADCAPRSTLGDGILSVADWVQAGRFAAGADQPTVAGGPMADAGAAAPPNEISPKISGRVMRVVSRTIQAAVTNTVVVQLDAQGGENALGFDLNFSPAQLQYVSASLGADAGGGVLNVNASQAATGKLGFVLALSPGMGFPTGTREVLKVNFAVAPTATGTADVTFGTGPVVAQVADISAVVQTTSYNDGALVISPFPPVLQLGLTGGVVTLTWPTVASNFTLQAHNGGGLAPVGWSNVLENPIVNGEGKMLTITNALDSQLFRLYKP